MWGKITDNALSCINRRKIVIVLRETCRRIELRLDAMNKAEYQERSRNLRVPNGAHSSAIANDGHGPSVSTATWTHQIQQKTSETFCERLATYQTTMTRRRSRSQLNRRRPHAGTIITGHTICVPKFHCSIVNTHPVISLIKQLHHFRG